MIPPACNHMFRVRRHEAVMIGQQPRGNHQQWDELLCFHEAKRLCNLPIDNHLKLHGVVRIRMGLSAPAYSSAGSLRHGLGGLVTATA